MKLYEELAEWWPLLSPSEEYAEEAAFFRRLIDGASNPRTLLELGSGGGNNASHLSAHFLMTLVDKSPRMLEVSRALNPHCEHVQGDMRTIRLGRTFDAVFVHDAIMYMTSEDELRAAIATAFEHCRFGGIAIFVPDYIRETFVSGTDTGGSDEGARGLRYLEWTYDPNPADTTFVTDYAVMLRDSFGTISVVHDHHVEGLFGRDDWLRVLAKTGFESRIVSDNWDRKVFVGKRIR